MDEVRGGAMQAKGRNAGTDVSQLPSIPFWQNIYPQTAGQPGFGIFGSGCAPNAGGIPSSSFNATQSMYDMFSCFAGNETTALFLADLPQPTLSLNATGPNPCVPSCATINGSTTPFAFFDDQWSSLYAWRSIGNSSYHGMQLTLRHAMAHGRQFDFNYTFSKSIDIGSNAERINEFEGFGFGSQIINSWSPNQLRSVSDFDTKHQLNANWVYEVPVGRGRHFGSGIGRIGDALIGGWGLSGIAHWTSGLPFSIGYGAG